MDFFRGYVPTKDKRCLLPFKNKPVSELRTLNEVKNLPEYAGILADEAILIDVDDFDQSEILMKIVEDHQLACRVYKTTRGKHFFFKNNGVPTNKTKTRLACGLEADIKLGTRNSYSILKFDGKERTILYDKFAEEEYSILPKWLFPIKVSMPFLTMEAGDGRNQALFNYILTLQSNDFSIDEVRETIKIINTYILKDPLSDSEIDTICRDDAFKKPIFYNGNTFLFDKFATYLKNNNGLVRLNGQLHAYVDGIYVSRPGQIETLMIQHIPHLSAAKRTEVLKYLDLLVGENVEMADAKYIAFGNGIYDIITDEFTGFSPGTYITNQIKHNYNPNAYSEIADRTLNKMACGDPQIRLLLEEVIGYTFYRRNELRKAFILTGDKANGKSTYLDMIKTLLGDRNTKALDLKELGERFKTAELFGVLANIGDDIEDEFIPNPAMFKRLVSGEWVNAERKGESPFDFKNYSKFLFSANSIPRMKDKTGAALDRLIIVPFNARFSPDDPDFDPYIKYKLRSEESMEYLIQIGIQGLKRVLTNLAFTTSAKVQKELAEYNELNNPILLFFKETELDEIENQPTNMVYQKYQEFCLSNSFQPMSRIEFSRQVTKRFDFVITDKKLSGKKYRIFVRKD